MLSSIQSLKAETRVKTEGFLFWMQPKGPKLTIPCTSQVVRVSTSMQENGPPESPCRTEAQAEDKRPVKMRFQSGFESFPICCSLMGCLRQSSLHSAGFVSAFG